MRRFIGLTLIISLSIVGLAGCGEQPLKFRNLIEADLYLRNNITQMDWNEFQSLLSNKHNVSKEEFMKLKKINKEDFKSKRTEIENKIYRFNPDDELIYMTEWKNKDDLLFLKDIYTINK